MSNTPNESLDTSEQVSNSTNNNSNENYWPRTATVSIDTEKVSIWVLLLCLFLPFMAPIFALIRWKFLFLLVIFILWFIAGILLFIPVLWIIIAIIINIIIAVKVAKMKKKTKINVTI